MRHIDWDRLVPPGLDGRKEANYLLFGLIAATVWSLCFFYSAYTQMERMIQNEMTVTPFWAILRTSHVGFALAAVCMLLVAGSHYLSHFQDGRSIYLMRRLPDRWELHRRCLLLPLAGLLAAAVLSLILVLAYFFLYRTLPPEELIPPPMWQGRVYRLLCWMFGAN